MNKTPSELGAMPVILVDAILGHPISSSNPIQTSDAGPAQNISRGVSGARFVSDDQSGGFENITDAPASGQKLVITDLLVSSDTSLRLDFAVEGATDTVIETVYMAANETKQITLRGQWKLPTVGKRLQVKTSALGNISVTACYYSEA